MGADHRDEGGRRLLAGAHELERRLADELKSGVKPSDPSVVQARAKLRDLFRELLLEHYELAVRKGVERSLWLIVFHRRIEEHRKKLRRASEAEQAAMQRPESVPESVRVSANASGQRARAGLLQVLEEAECFYEMMLGELQRRNGVDCRLGPLSPGSMAEPDAASEPAMRFIEAAAHLEEAPSARTTKTLAVRASCASCLIFLGDLARYRQLHAEAPAAAPTGTGAGGRWAAALALYGVAQLIAPQSGNAHNQMAVIATYEARHSAAMYHYMRALAAPAPFSTARENLLTFFARLGSKGLVPKGPQGEAEEVSEMLLAMCQVHGALFPRHTPRGAPQELTGAEVERSLARGLSKLRSLVMSQRLDPGWTAPLLLTAITAHHLAACEAAGPTVAAPTAAVAAASAASPAAANAASAVEALPRLLDLVYLTFSALVPQLSLAIGPQRVAQPEYQKPVVSLLAAFLPMCWWLRQQHERHPSAVRVVPRPVASDAARTSLAQALVALGNTLPEEARRRPGRGDNQRAVVGHAQLELLGLPLAVMVQESLQASTQAGGGARSMAADDAGGLVRAHAAAIAACLRSLAAPGPEPPLLTYDEQSSRFGPAVSGPAVLAPAPQRVLPRYSSSHGAAAPACAAAAPPPSSDAVGAPRSLAGGAPAHAAGASAMPPPACCLPVPTMTRLTSPTAGLGLAPPPPAVFAAAPPSCFGAGAGPSSQMMGLITPAQLAASSAPAAHAAAAPPAHMPNPSLRVLDHPFAPRPAVAGLTVEPEPSLPAFFGRVLSQPALHALESLEPPAGPGAPNAASAPQLSPEELLSRVASLNETTKQAMLGLLPADYQPEPGCLALPPLPAAAPPATWGAWGAFPSPLDTPSWGGMPVPAPAPEAAPFTAPAFQT